jgi:anti-anti-sigma factor
VPIVTHVPGADRGGSRGRALLDTDRQARLFDVDRPDLSVSVRRGSAEAVVALTGEIDMSTVHRLVKVVDDILGTDPPPRVVLDLAGITFCDSQGLGTLVVLSRRASMTQSCIVLVNVGDFLLRVLDITGLRDALMIQNAAA